MVVLERMTLLVTALAYQPTVVELGRVEDKGATLR